MKAIPVLLPLLLFIQCGVAAKSRSCHVTVFSQKDFYGKEHRFSYEVTDVAQAFPYRINSFQVHNSCQLIAMPNRGFQFYGPFSKALADASAYPISAMYVYPSGGTEHRKCCITAYYNKGFDGAHEDFCDVVTFVGDNWYNNIYSFTVDDDCTMIGMGKQFQPVELDAIYGPYTGHMFEVAHEIASMYIFPV